MCLLLIKHVLKLFPSFNLLYKNLVCLCLFAMLRTLPTPCFTAAGSLTTPSSTPWILSISPLFSSLTLAYWWQWALASVRWDRVTQTWELQVSVPSRSSSRPAGVAWLCWVLPVWWGPPGAWPSWDLDTSTTPSCTFSASSTPYKVSVAFLALLFEPLPVKFRTCLFESFCLILSGF